MVGFWRGVEKSGGVLGVGICSTSGIPSFCKANSKKIYAGDIKLSRVISSLSLISCITTSGFSKIS